MNMRQSLELASKGQYANEDLRKKILSLEAASEEKQVAFLNEILLVRKVFRVSW